MKLEQQKDNEISAKIEKTVDWIRKLGKMEEYVVDRIENEFAVCENRKTGEMINIKLQELPKNIKEGNYLILKEGKYFLSEKEEQDIKQRIEDKMNNLWK